MVGKVPPDDLSAHVFDRTGAADDRVRQGPAYGEDAAAIAVDDRLLVVSTDPISLAADRVGTLGVPVACNDVAASGADPAWLTVAVFLPEGEPELIEPVTEQLHTAALEADVAIVGGHSEYNAALSRPLLSLTAMGPADRFVPTGGAEPGDRVLLTGGVGLEGTAILASDFRGEALDAGVDEATLERAVGYVDEIGVTPAARRLRSAATAMHDPTEGGVLTGLFELAAASGALLDIDREGLPVREPTRVLCDAMGVDPLRIFGSGALIATVPPSEVEGARDALAGADVPAAEIGRVRAGDPAVRIDGRRVTTPVRDDLYALWE